MIVNAIVIVVVRAITIASVMVTASILCIYADVRFIVIVWAVVIVRVSILDGVVIVIGMVFVSIIDIVVIAIASKIGIAVVASILDTR